MGKAVDEAKCAPCGVHTILAQLDEPVLIVAQGYAGTWLYSLLYVRERTVAMMPCQEEMELRTYLRR